MKWQRQIIRMRYEEDEMETIRNFALDQIERAIVLHVDAAWSHLKWALKNTAQLKCDTCGNRHIRRLEKQESWGKTICSYGFFDNFVSLTRGTWFHLFHGED